MSLPNEIRSIPLIMGNDSVECTKIKLLPANATGNTAFTATTNNRVVFNIPAYPNSFINPKRSYISFKGKVASTVALDKARFVDGLPVIERLVLRAGNGVILEDIQDYYLIERILNSAMDKESLEAKGDLVGDRRAYITGTGTSTATGQVANIYTEDKAGRIFTKDLLSGVLGKHQDMYVPVGLFETSGGFSFQLELYLATNAIACRNDTGANAVSYELTDMRMNLEIVQFEDEIMRIFNTAVLKGNAIEMPFKSFRLHRSVVQGVQSIDVNITESAHNIDQVYTAILPTTYANTQKAGAFTTADELTTDNLSGDGGTSSSNSNYQVKMYQFRYGTKYYPTDKVENNGTTDTNATYLASMSSIDALSKPTWLASRSVSGTRNWENNYFIAQGFKTFAGRNVLNGLNTSSSGAPLQLFLEFIGNATVIINSFVQAQHRLHIKAGGMASLIDG